MPQPGFFDYDNVLEQLSKQDNPLFELNELVDWKIFTPLLAKLKEKQRKSNAGRPAYRKLLLFKMLVLQTLYNLSDKQTEFQCRDRLSFRYFLGLEFEDKIPDATTLWLFREALIQQKLEKRLFNRFNKFLDAKGLSARCGQIIDASIIESPRQRNSRDENKLIKAGKTPEEWKNEPNMLRQKDVDARWTKKGGQNYFGYKSHINIDAEHKLIRDFDVTDASKSDIGSFEKLLDHKQEDKHVWADAAYYSESIEEKLRLKGFSSRIINRNGKREPIWSARNRENSRRSKIRKRVEHVFGFIKNSMNGRQIRTIGIKRASLKLAMTNLVYNLCRYKTLAG